jgi:hypothetical protein
MDSDPVRECGAPEKTHAGFRELFTHPVKDLEPSLPFHARVRFRAGDCVVQLIFAPAPGAQGRALPGYPVFIRPDGTKLLSFRTAILVSQDQLVLQTT